MGARLSRSAFSLLVHHFRDRSRTPNPLPLPRIAVSFLSSLPPTLDIIESSITMDIHQGPRTRSQAPAQAPINPEETPKKAKVIDLDIEEDADDCADEGDNGEPSEGSDAQTEERDPYEDDDFEK